MGKRGRPKSIVVDPESLPKKFERRYVWEDGIIAIWKFNLDISSRGPVETEFIYPKNYKTADEKRKENNSKLPKKYREYINPKNGKIVGYARAKSLGLI